MKLSASTKAVIAASVTGFVVMLLSTGSTFAQSTNQPAPTEQPGQSSCPCCRNMQSMGS